LNVDFSNLSLDPLDLRRPVHAGVKEGSSLKSGYLSAVGLSSVWLQIGTDKLHNISSTGNELFGLSILVILNDHGPQNRCF